MSSTDAPNDTLSRSEQELLLGVARDSIAQWLVAGRALDLDPAAFPPALRDTRASFVTLRRPDGALRGCVGELEASRPLVHSVADRARAAAFGDPRFRPLAAHELDEVGLHVSVLGDLEPIDAASEAELLAALRPGVDGLVIDDGAHRATFLPAVWESLREPRHFLRELFRKAGLVESAWPPRLRAWRYEVLEFGES